MTKAPSLKLLALIQFLIGAVISGLGYVFGDIQLAASMAIGSALMLFNLIGLGWSWQRLLAQKSIAWTLLIIVIKYAVLLGSIFFLAREPWFSSLGAGLGISSFVLAALIMALIFRKDIA